MLEFGTRKVGITLSGTPVFAFPSNIPLLTRGFLLPKSLPGTPLRSTMSGASTTASSSPVSMSVFSGIDGSNEPAKAEEEQFVGGTPNEVADPQRAADVEDEVGGVDMMMVEPPSAASSTSIFTLVK